VVAAVGTVGAVVVALFLPDWQRAKLRPVVTLSFDSITDDIALHDRPPWVGVWIRFRVHNKEGRETVRKVRVVVSKVESLTELRIPGDTLAFRELSWAEISIGELDIPAGMERRVDVVHVDKVRKATEAGVRPWPGLGLGLAMWPRLYDGRDYLGEGRFLIRLAVAGDNFDASEWETYVSFDKTELSEQSSLEEIRKALVVSSPTLISRRK
jgi:hypothetical protein